MRWSKTVTVVGCHSEGEVGRVITGGVLPPPGKTMFERMKHLEAKADDLRQMLLFDPRGAVTHSVNFVLPPCHPDADVGVVVMESNFYVPMSGSNTIFTATVVLETWMVLMREPETKLIFDMPGGLVCVVATCRSGKCEQVTFRNVPCFVWHLDRVIEVSGIGQVTVDVVYGGMIYAIVDAAKLGFAIVPKEARDLVAVGERIKAAAAEQLSVVHPENPDIHTINQTLFAGPLLESQKGGKTSRNAVVVSPGRLDRSPCGTGTSARLAVLHAKGQIKTGERFDHESIIGTHFIGMVVEETRCGNLRAVVSTISGRGWITGIMQYGVDPDDPFPTGYTLADTWFA
jgi:proline racemase